METGHDFEAAVPDAVVEDPVETHSVDRACQLEADNSCLSSIEQHFSNNQKEGNGKFPQQFALSEQVCDLHPEYFIIEILCSTRSDSVTQLGAQAKGSSVTHHNSRVIQHILWLRWFILLLFFGYLNVFDIASTKHNVVELLL